MKALRSVLVLSALLWASGPLFAEGPTPRPGAGGPKTDLIHDEEIRSLYKKFVDAWNRHDVETLVGLWAIDGDHIEPDGRHAKGRDEIGKLLTAEHTTVFKDSKLKLELATVWFITADVALADGSYELTNVTGPKGNPLPARTGHLTSVLMHERDQWWVAASRLMIPVPLVWREED